MSQWKISHNCMVSKLVTGNLLPVVSHAKDLTDVLKRIHKTTLHVLSDWRQVQAKRVFWIAYAWLWMFVWARYARRRVPYYWGFISPLHHSGTNLLTSMRTHTVVILPHWSNSLDFSDIFLFDSVNLSIPEHQILKANRFLSFSGVLMGERLSKTCRCVVYDFYVSKFSM